MLLNQTKASGGSNSPATSDGPKTVPTYGYHATTGEAVLFDLAEGAKLPAGYVDSPAKTKNASKA